MIVSHNSGDRKTQTVISRLGPSQHLVGNDAAAQLTGTGLGLVRGADGSLEYRASTTQLIRNEEIDTIYISPTK